MGGKRSTKQEMFQKRQKTANEKLILLLMDEIEGALSRGETSRALHFQSRMTKLEERNREIDKRLKKGVQEDTGERKDGRRPMKSPWPSIFEMPRFGPDGEPADEFTAVEKRIGMSFDEWHERYYDPAEEGGDQGYMGIGMFEELPQEEPRKGLKANSPSTSKEDKLRETILARRRETGEEEAERVEWQRREYGKGGKKAAGTKRQGTAKQGAPFQP